MNTRPTYYEWDEAKRRANIAKHEVDFTAMEAFEWETAHFELDDDSYEERWIAKGFIGQQLYTVVYTERSDRTRIVSLRKATAREARDYVENQT